MKRVVLLSELSPKLKLCDMTIHVSQIKSVTRFF
jgi:hypothetical protein